MDLIKFNEIDYEPIKVVATPDVVRIEGIKAKKCTNNSKLIIENNSDLEISYVEGVVMTQIDNHIHAVRHAWNKIGAIYFDATLEALDYNTKGSCDFDRDYYISKEPNVINLITSAKGVVEYSVESLDFMNYMVNKFPKKE
jgi:hypothetical protein